MKLGLHITSFTWPGGDRAIRQTLARIATDAEAAGFARVSVLDHMWQISMNGDETEPMLESYTALGYLAGVTSRVELLTLVTGASYREPGLLAKIVSTLDVISGGRAWLGLGAGWNEQAATGLGLEMPYVSERFRRLEEVLQICLQMWSGEEGPYQGRYYTLGRTLNRPLPLARPRPRILIGGAGERQTLRLVAKYADACNMHGGPFAARKLEVLKKHCADIGRDYDSIEKTALYPLDLDADGATGTLLEQLRRLHELGFETVHGPLKNVANPAALERFATDVIPEVSSW